MEARGAVRRRDAGVSVLDEQEGRHVLPPVAFLGVGHEGRREDVAPSCAFPDPLGSCDRPQLVEVLDVLRARGAADVHAPFAFLGNHPLGDAEVSARIGIWLRAIRVNQWTKNGIVFLAWFFAVADPSQAAMARGWRPFVLVSAMAAAFCLVSSAFYLLNDVADFNADRRHPVKRLRPIAARLVSRIDAVRVALSLFAVGL
ncbi:MAG: UbiA family prenyltransferase, partial [Kiritimatiellae bacterium]|nr:UbiA family prenyltransferase [Kiritimatiellia bacterium]